ncbi:MAG: hypothetical protein Q8J80_04905 [Gallionella sp.]|nr:hypothetical protein [Gallionella sp.]
MERVLKQNGESADSQRTAQAKFTSKSREAEQANSIDDSPAMVAQRKMLQSLFGGAIQRVEDEEPLQGKFEALQRVEEEESLQGKFEAAQCVSDAVVQCVCGQCGSARHGQKDCTASQDEINAYKNQRMAKNHNGGKSNHGSSSDRPKNRQDKYDDDQKSSYSDKQKK